MVDHVYLSLPALCRRSPSDQDAAVAARLADIGLTLQHAPDPEGLLCGQSCRTAITSVSI